MVETDILSRDFHSHWPIVLIRTQDLLQGTKILKSQPSLLIKSTPVTRPNHQGRDCFKRTLREKRAIRLWHLPPVDGADLTDLVAFTTLSAPSRSCKLGHRGRQFPMSSCAHHHHGTSGTSCRGSRAPWSPAGSLTAAWEVDPLGGICAMNGRHYCIHFLEAEGGGGG